MRSYLLLFLFITTNVYSALGDLEAPSRLNLLSNSTRALLSYDHIQEGADQFVNTIKRKTLGEHSDKVLMLLPLVTGELEFSISDVNIYHKAHREETGVKYVYNF